MNKTIELPRGNYIEIVVEQDIDAQNPMDTCDMAVFHIADSRGEFEAILDDTGITRAGAEAMAGGERGHHLWVLGVGCP